ncbi:MAG: tetratricopeptide repeat protein, partial [Pirellulaceae bacterium]
RPLPEAISEDEFNRLLAVATSGKVPGIGSESAEGVLRDWYYKDENFRPAGPSQEPPLQYLLQSRQRDLGDGKNYGRDAKQKDTADWLAVQRVLWDLVNAAFPPESLAGRFTLDWQRHAAAVAQGRAPLPQIVRFQGSATEQEIWAGALAVPNPGGHVRAFFREITNRDVFSDPAEIRDFFDLTESGAIDDDAQQAQADLKEALTTRLGAHAVTPMPHSRLKRENGRTVVDASKDDLQQLCDEGVAQLTAIIRRQIQEHWRLAELPEPAASPADGEPQPVGPSEARKLELERQAHARFGDERTQQFQGRDEELKQIAAYLADDSDRRPLLVHGPPGTGKTAILAEAAKRTEEHFKPIVRFLGVTPDASDLRGLLASLCRELEDRVPAETRKLPAEPDKLQEELLRRLATGPAQRPIVIVLDALDQLSPTDGRRRLAWLPWTLPEHARLVVSCISGVADDDPLGEPYRELKRRADHQSDFLERAIAVESLTPHDALTLIDRWLEHAQTPRQLIDKQRTVIKQRILPEEAVACRRPIYLRILFEECRLWPSYRSVSLEELGPDAAALLETLLTRLERPAQHGFTATRALGYLGSARRGLSEIEILEVLWQDEDYHKYLEDLNRQYGHTLPPGATRIPIALWARLRQDLAPYLAEQAAPGASVLTFYHREVGAVVRQRFVEQPDLQQQFHLRLADYFENRPTDARRIDELPWQLAQAADWCTLHQFLADLPSLRALYELNESDVRRYWTQLERNSAFRSPATYRDLLLSPTSEPATAWLVGVLLINLGHTELATAFWQSLAGHFKKTEQTANRARALINGAECARVQGITSEAIQCFREAVPILRSNKDWRGVVASFVGLANIHLDRRELAEALSLYRKAERLATRMRDKPGLACSLGGQARIMFCKGEYKKALQLLRQEEKICAELGDPGRLSRCWLVQAEFLSRVGSFAEAAKLHKKAEDACRKIGDKDGEASAIGSRAMILEHQGEWDKALRLLHLQEWIYKNIDAQYGLANGYGNQAKILLSLIQRDGSHRALEAISLLQKQELIARQLNYQTALLASLQNQAVALRVLGKYDIALALLAEKEAISRALDDNPALASCLQEQANILLRNVDNETLVRAEAILREKETICRKLSLAKELASCLGTLALVFRQRRQRGDSEMALELYTEVESIQKNLRDEPSMAVTLYNRGTLLRDDLNNPIEAQQSLDGSFALARKYRMMELLQRFGS